MVEAHESSEVVEIANCGHVCNVENPEEFNQRSIAFIQKQISDSLGSLSEQMKKLN